MSFVNRLIAGGTFLALASACTSTDTTPASDAGAAPSVSVDLAVPTPMTSAPLDISRTLTRIAFGSCMKQEDDQSIWHRVAATDPDVFLFIGDNVYGDNYSGTPGLPELNSAYALLARSEPFAKFRQETPVLVTWDDHDYGFNDAGATFIWREDSERLFEEVWAMPEAARSRPGVYDAWMVGEEDGKRVQIILLDTRYFRSDLKPTDEKNAAGKERYLPDDDAAKTMLGDGQWQWLEAELSKPADLRIIASSIQVIADGHGWEAWRTLPKERERLYNLIGAAGAENVVFISGDRHAGSMYKRDYVVPYPLYEVTSSSLNAPLSTFVDVTAEDFKDEPGPYRLTDIYYEVNFGLIDIDWDKEEIEMKLVDGEGEVAMNRIIPLADLRPVY